MTSRKPTQDLAIQVVQDNTEFFTNDKEKSSLQESVPWLCLDLKNWSKFWQFVILSISVFFFYLVSPNYLSANSLLTEPVLIPDKIVSPISSVEWYLFTRV